MIVPQLSWVNTSVEKAKTDRHDSARDRSLFTRFFESLKTYAASSEEPALSSQGVDNAPNSVFRILGASPKFKIVDFYGQMRVIKPNSPIALFAALNTSLKDQKLDKECLDLSRTPQY